jgi:hypothetical protein
MFMSKSDNYYRHTLGAEARADTEKQHLKEELGTLAMFPVATIFWTRGVRGGDADLRWINEAIRAAVGSPERMTPAAWAFLENGAHYEPVRPIISGHRATTLLSRVRRSVDRIADTPHRPATSCSRR